MYCGAELNCESECAASERSDNYDALDGAVIAYFSCPKCGRYYEVWEPNKSERDGEYKEFWGHGDNG